MSSFLTRRPRAPWLPLAFALALAAPVAHANDVDVAVSQRVPIGGQPTVTLQVNKDLVRATVDVKSANGATARQTLGPAAVGERLVFSLPAGKAGKALWSGTLTVEFEDGSRGSLPLRSATETLSAFRIAVRDEDVDLERHRLVVTSEHPTARVELTVYGERGAVLAAVGKDFGGAKPQAPLALEWVPKTPGLTLRIDVEVEDVSGVRQSVRLFPYNISIPHEEVEFETGKHEVRPAEEGKLMAARTAIDDALDRYGEAVRVEGVQVRLFVHGHTDTVGPPAANQALSERRALAIARWFKSRGVPVAIYARGFGESSLKVETGDEIDEQANRRVDYDVGVRGPTGSTAGWMKVQ